MTTMTEEEWGLFEQRNKGLEKMSGVLEERLKELNDPNRVTFQDLLEGLKDFANAQFDFLYDGLRPNSDAGYRLEPSLRYPAEFVLGATLDQYAFDLTVLQGALDQRLLAQETGNEAMKNTFKVADRLARDALRPAFEYGLLPYDEGEIEVLTYFQKAPNIRIIPYAPVALVGMPWTTLAMYDGKNEEVGNARDLLAIPHEIGHYVYRHGLSTDSRLQDTLHFVLQGKPEWLLYWAEEVFSDVYGCFVAGPVIARDFQDLMRDNDVDSFLQDDTVHPTPVLRPLLYCDALTVLAHKVLYPDGVPEEVELDEDEKPGIAKVAEARWDEFRRGRGEDHIEERRGVIRDAIKQTLELLIEQSPDNIDLENLWSELNPDPDPEADGTEAYKKLYENFHKKVTSDGFFEEEAHTVKGYVAAAAEDPMEKNEAMQWLKDTRKKERADGRIPAEVWTTIASMHGWATKGPENDPNLKI